MKMQISVLGMVLLALFLPGVSLTDSQELPSFAVRAGKIFTMSAFPSIPEVIEDGIFIVRNGKIEAVGKDLVIPPGMKVLDYSASTIVPGLIAAGSAFGKNKPQELEDTASAQHLALDEFDPFEDYRTILNSGVTAAYLDPGWTRLIPGQGAVVKLGGAGKDSRILSASAGISVNLGEAAFGPPPKIVYPFEPSSDYKIVPARRQRPESRLGQFLELEAQFRQARARGSVKGQEYNSNLDALAEELKKNKRFRFYAEREADLFQAVLFVRKMGLNACLVGGTEAHRAVDAIAAAGLPVVLEMPVSFGKVSGDMGSDPDRMDESLHTAAVLAEKGVPFALAVSRGEDPGDLRLAAAAAVRGGLCPDKALQAVTRVPAEILGIADRVGSLTPGKDADFLVLSGPALSVSTHVEKTYINGSCVFSSSMLMKKDEDAVVVRAGTIYTACGPPIHGGAVLIEGGKISAVGPTVPYPAYAKVIDAGPDAVVTPGFIDARGHLGLNGDKASAPSNLCPAQGIAVAEPNFSLVARAGVTTVLVSPYVPNRAGSQISAIKTCGESRDDLVVRERAGLVFTFRGQDPSAGVNALEGILKGGKAYHDSWQKYYSALKKWEEEQAKKEKEAEAKSAEEEQKKAEEAKKSEAEKKNAPQTEEVEEIQKKVDPVSGKWEGKISGGPLPEPADFAFYLKLDGTKITGKAVSPMGGDEAAISGTLTGKHLVLEIEAQDSPIGSPKIEADIDRDDHMVGKFIIGDMVTLDLEASRTEKEVKEIKVTTRRKTKDAQGKPQPPKVNETLEPFRDLFEGKTSALVDVDSHFLIRQVVELFQKYKISLVLLEAEEAELVAESLLKAKVGVVVPAAIIRRWNNRPYHEADRLSRAGIPVAFQSHAEDGARGLPMKAAYAVYKGMDAAEAIKALTCYPAKMFHIDDRVGSLQKGRDGDLVIFSGPPFEVSSRVITVLVGGKEVIE